MYLLVLWGIVGSDLMYFGVAWCVFVSYGVFWCPVYMSNTFGVLIDFVAQFSDSSAARSTLFRTALLLVGHFC